MVIQALRGGAPQFGSTDPGDSLGLIPVAKLKVRNILPKHKWIYFLEVHILYIYIHALRMIKICELNCFGQVLGMSCSRGSP